MYDLTNFTGDKPNTTIKRLKICYCRVSSQGQKDDLQRQISFMRDHFPNHTIMSDIGSGINFKRKGLRTILEQSCKGLVEEVVVAYRDRLCRFAFELLQWIFQCHGVKLVVYNNGVEDESTGPDNGELAEDLLAIINVFNCRVNGKRKYQRKIKASEAFVLSTQGSGEQTRQDKEIQIVP
jgi:predicted site-specific integrase-resolvase